MEIPDLRAVILDVDGTTIASGQDGLPSSRVIDSLQEAQSEVHVALATGRTRQMSQAVTDALGLKGPSIFNGGAEVIDVTTDEVLYVRDLSVTKMRDLVDLCLPFGYKLYAINSHIGESVIEPELIIEDARQLFVEGVRHHDAINMLEELVAIAGIAAHTSSTWMMEDEAVDIHITHEQATKGHGVDQLINMLDLDRNQVMAIGNDHNDLPMMKAVGFKVVMGDATDELKAIADFVAPACAEDGVAVAVERFVLNR